MIVSEPMMGTKSSKTTQSMQKLFSSLNTHDNPNVQILNWKKQFLTSFVVLVSVVLIGELFRKTKNNEKKIGRICDLSYSICKQTVKSIFDSGVTIGMYLISVRLNSSCAFYLTLVFCQCYMFHIKQTSPTNVIQLHFFHMLKTSLFRLSLKIAIAHVIVACQPSFTLTTYMLCNRETRAHKSHN